MATSYINHQRTPSKPHQCMHSSEKDGTRCRASAMHNEYMCYNHRNDDVPTVIQNDPFELGPLDDRAAIQRAYSDISARLACNHMDLQRAAILIQAVQGAAKT
jgi:hypothetical protein